MLTHALLTLTDESYSSSLNSRYVSTDHMRNTREAVNIITLRSGLKETKISFIHPFKLKPGGGGVVKIENL